MVEHSNVGRRILLARDGEPVYCEMVLQDVKIPVKGTEEFVLTSTRRRKLHSPQEDSRLSFTGRCTSALIRTEQWGQDAAMI